jgi:hypothetical protein
MKAGNIYHLYNRLAARILRRPFIAPITASFAFTKNFNHLPQNP